MGFGKMLRTDTAPQHDRAVLGEGSVFGEILIDGTRVVSPMRLYSGGMQIPGAFRAALIISDLLGSVPWDAFKTSRGAAGGVDTTAIYPAPPLLERPNPQEDRIATISSATLDLVWNGNAVWVIASRSPLGVPTAVLPVPAENVQIRRANMSDYSPIPSGAIEYLIGGWIFNEWDVIHIKGPCKPGAIRGFGVLEAQLQTLQLAQEQQDQASSIAQHGVPTGVLKVDDPDATTQEMRDIKTGWLESQRARSIAVLNATTDFEPLSWNPHDMEMVDARKFTLHELALVFGLPLSFLGADQSSRTYSNIEQEAINLLKFSLNGHLGRFEQAISHAFPKRTWVKANLEAILRADTLTRYQAHQLALSGRWMAPSEVRDIEDRAPFTPEQLEEIKANAPAPIEPATTPGAPKSPEEGKTP